MLGVGSDVLKGKSVNKKLISRAYLEEQYKLHARGGYGEYGSRWAPAVMFLAKQIEAESILDYGCGAGSLARTLSWYYMQVEEYDPAIPEKDWVDHPADLVVCTDVLEHIEPDKLDNVLEHIHSLTKKMLFAVVATQRAGKVLSDGRNAHLIIETEKWWRMAVDKHFSVKKTWYGGFDKWVAFLRPR